MGKEGVLGFVKNLDAFSNDVPSFNINGKSSVKTWMGACITINIFMLACAFGLLKL